MAKCSSYILQFTVLSTVFRYVDLMRNQCGFDTESPSSTCPPFIHSLPLFLPPKHISWRRYCPEYRLWVAPGIYSEVSRCAHIRGGQDAPKHEIHLGAHCSINLCISPVSVAKHRLVLTLTLAPAVAGGAFVGGSYVHWWHKFARHALAHRESVKDFHAFQTTIMVAY